MKRILYAILVLIVYSSCQQHVLPEQSEDKCVLELNITRADVPTVSSRAIDAGLAVRILDANGKEYLNYPAGDVPSRIILEPGLFAVCAYTDNQETWHSANHGKGEACYYSSLLVKIEYDHTTRVSMSVPMTNYAVGVALPEKFEELFPSHQLTLKSGSREVVIQEGEKAYFSKSDGGFTHALSVTNIDGMTNSYLPRSFTDVQSGKCYLLSYSYGFDETPQNIRAEVHEISTRE